MKKYYFTSGLPRCGNTLISSILNQNPNIFATGLSCLPEVFYRLLTIAEDDIAFNTSPCPENLQNVFVNLFDTFYKNKKEDIIIDRSNWITPFNYPVLHEYCPNDVKILILVRPMVEVIKSYLKVCQNSPLFYINQQYNQIDKSTLYKSELETKVDLILQKEHEVDRNLYSIKWLVDNDYAENVRILDYNDLIDNPKESINFLYEWYDIPKYNHDFKNLKQVSEYGVRYTDNEYLQADLHTIRTNGIEKLDNDIELPDHLVKLCESLNVWEGKIKRLGD